MPVLVIPGVLSTFEPIKTTLAGAVGIFAVALSLAVHLLRGTFSLSAMSDVVTSVRGLRGVRAVGAVSLGVIGAVSILGSITSVAPDTSWFGSLGRGQGTLFLVAVGAVVALAGPAVASVGGVGSVLRALAIGAVPCAIATILQRYGLDPVTGLPCDVERLQTTIGNALPGSTYFGITTLLGLEHARLAWLRWRVRRDLATAVDALAHQVASAPPVPAVETRAARRRTRRVVEGRELAVGAPIAVATTADASSSAWIGDGFLLAGGVAALFAGSQIARADFARTWVAIPLALTWGAAVARTVSRNIAVPPGVAVAGWAGVVVLSSVANGLTLSRGPQLGLLAAGAVWVVAVATMGARRFDLRDGALAAAGFAGAVVVTGASWFIPVVGCRPQGAAAPVPTVAAVAAADPRPASANSAAPPAPAAPDAPPVAAASAPALSGALDRAVAMVNDRLNFQGSSASAASLGWRANVWTHALNVYADRPPSVEAKARAMAAALAGAQYGDVAALNRSPGSRAPGGWWYRIMGFGPESQVFTLATSTSPEIRAVQGEITYDRAHNVVLDVLLTTGAVGLVAWAVNLGAAFVLGWRLRRLGTAGAATAALAPVLVCILVSGLSGVDATVITLINWVVIATCIIVPTTVPTTASRRSAPAPTGRRSTVVATSTESLGDDLTRLGVVAGVLLAACVGASVLGLGATTPLAWAVGAFVGLCVAGLAVVERPFPRGRPDLGVITVTVVAALVATIVMVPGWSAMAAGHYARLTQDAALPKDRVQAYAKRAVALDPGQATYRVLAGG